MANQTGQMHGVHGQYWGHEGPLQRQMSEIAQLFCSLRHQMKLDCRGKKIAHVGQNAGSSTVFETPGILTQHFCPCFFRWGRGGVLWAAGYHHRVYLAPCISVLQLPMFLLPHLGFHQLECHAWLSQQLEKHSVNNLLQEFLDISEKINWNCFNP